MKILFILGLLFSNLLSAGDMGNGKDEKGSQANDEKTHLKAALDCRHKFIDCCDCSLERCISKVDFCFCSHAAKCKPSKGQAKWALFTTTTGGFAIAIAVGTWAIYNSEVKKFQDPAKIPENPAEPYVLCAYDCGTKCFKSVVALTTESVMAFYDSCKEYVSYEEAQRLAQSLVSQLPGNYFVCITNYNHSALKGLIQPANLVDISFTHYSPQCLTLNEGYFFTLPFLGAALYVVAVLIPFCCCCL